MTHSKCGECRSYFECDYACENDWACEDFEPQGKTVFDRITTSPEVLAPYFVFAADDAVLHRHDERKKLYYSSVTGGYYQYKENAIAATVEKLKEVEK